MTVNFHDGVVGVVDHTQTRALEQARGVEPSQLGYHR